MGTPGKNKDLLNEVWAERTAPEFRAALLDQTIVAARRRARRKSAVTLAGVLVAAVTVLALYLNDAQDGNPVLPEWGGVTIVHTAPLRPRDIVRTLPSETPLFLPSQSVAVVHTHREASHVRIVGDRELLAQIGTRAALLVQSGPSSKKLVFANPEDGTLIYAQVTNLSN